MPVGSSCDVKFVTKEFVKFAATEKLRANAFVVNREIQSLVFWYDSSLA